MASHMKTDFLQFYPQMLDTIGKISLIHFYEFIFNSEIITIPIVVEGHCSMKVYQALTDLLFQAVFGVRAKNSVA